VTYLSKRSKRGRASAKSAAHKKTAAAKKLWPSDDEQTLEALRAGLIDALVIPKGTHERIYALKTFEELQAANAELRASQERLLLLLNERERLLQDLHDGCIQSIYAVGLGLEDCRDLITRRPTQAAKKVAQAEASLNLVIQELRAFISGYGLEAPVDLAHEIERIIQAVGRHGPRISVDINAKVAGALPRDHAAQLLQIAREGLSNIVRHANAKSGRISLRKRGRVVRLEVADDGDGFDATAEKGSGLGLHHIAARVQRLGGRLKLSSKPAGGSSIVVELGSP
jgi:signal transduction histidine kinase